MKGRYPRMNIRGERGHREIRPHRAMLVLGEPGGETALFEQLYDLYSEAGFQADHRWTCSPLCVNPDHLQWLDHESHLNKTLRDRYGI